MLYSRTVTKLIIKLKLSPEQHAQLRRLQQMFALACNALAPIVSDSRCWNRVTLHHLSYRQLREQFPGLGSQMVCNAIYSVSRTARMVYQGPASPFNLARWGGKPVPRIQFTPNSPVYFDRHTLSIKGGQLSMFTLDGRMRFELKVSAQDEQRFREDKLQEIILSCAEDQYQLSFAFAEPVESAAPQGDPDTAELPEYIVVLADANPPEPIAIESL